MFFSRSVRLFQFGGIGIIGSLATGCSFGLSEEAFLACTRLYDGDVSLEGFKKQNEALYSELSDAGFFDDVEAVSSIKSCYLHITQACNMNCVGCYSWSRSRNVSKDLSTSEVFHVLDGLRNMSIERIVISGGEPFLRDDLPQILRYARESCSIDKIEVITNGTLLSREAVRSVKDFVDCIALSIDRASSKYPSLIRKGPPFEKLVDCVTLIRQEGIKAHLIATIHSENYEQYNEFINLACFLGASLNFSLLSCPVDGDCRSFCPDDSVLKKIADSAFTSNSMFSTKGKSYSNFFQNEIKGKCAAGAKVASVGHDGNVYPCHMLHVSDMCAGNILKDSLEEIALNLHSFSSRCSCVDDIAKCRDCDYRYYCGGGCRARSLLDGGNLDSPDSYCAMNMRFYELCEHKAIDELTFRKFA